MPTECTRYSMLIGIKKIQKSGDLNFQKWKTVALSQGGFTVPRLRNRLASRLGYFPFIFFKFNTRLPVLKAREGLIPN